MTMISLRALLLLTFFTSANSLHFPLEARRRTSILKRTTGSSTVSTQFGTEYVLNLTLAGTPFTVLMDTGSSDLWVAAAQNSGFTNTGVTAEVQFVIGSDEGPVMIADMEFSDITVPSQAFIFVTPDEDSPLGQGLIGLGPYLGSQVLTAVQDTSANPALDRIFEQETSAETFITVQLGRTNDPDTSSSGALTIGEVLQQYNNITSTPKLPVTIVAQDFLPNQHWQTLTDSNGISVNGKAITTPSNASLNFNSSASNTLAFIFDTGFTYPQVPGYIADAFYQDIKGAQLQNVSGVGEAYVLPCDAEVNITFSFGGQTIPIHPLDANFQVPTNDGSDLCIGSFMTAQPGVQSPFEDGNLGMAFLRNVYMLINFGFLAEGATTDTPAPYIQLLPLTDPAQAHQDFLSVRGGGKKGSGTGANGPSATGGSKSGASLSRSVSTALAFFSALLASAFIVG